MFASVGSYQATTRVSPGGEPQLTPQIEEQQPMHRKSVSQSGALNPRLFIAFLLVSAARWLAMICLATPTPPHRTNRRTKPSVTDTDPTGAPPNLTGVAQGKPTCGPSNAACSVFTLTVDPSVTTAATGYD